MNEMVEAMPVVLQQATQADEKLDAKIWSALPEELIDRVLACLPVPVLLQFRSVCRRWSSLTVSASFRKLRVEAPVSGPHFLVFELEKPGRWGAYDPRLEKWYTVPMSILEAEDGIFSVAAQGGLICIVIRKHWYAGPTTLLLCNPVTRCSFELPPTCLQKGNNTWIPQLIALVVNKEENSFKVIAAGYQGCPHHPACYCRNTEVYNSVTNSWEIAADLPWNMTIDYKLAPHTVCRGNLYCVVRTYSGDLALVVFVMEKKVWHEVPLQMPFLMGSQVLVFERRGSLVLVQQLGRMFGVPKIYTWEPGTTPRRFWTEDQSLLPRLNRHFQELFGYDEFLMWTGHGDLIFFISHSWDRGLLYDMAQKSWTLTPVDKFLRAHHPPLLAIPLDFDIGILSNERFVHRPIAFLQR